ncbi:T9SS type A sorting domain-containing protein [Larkinella sp. GY13]|uniref:T9SS type A sorting domain-containing protein n=1 Tax=Larkinella sp. GY13 TaxID=3453720 RepID=UPI003EECBE27
MRNILQFIACLFSFSVQAQLISINAGTGEFNLNPKYKISKDGICSSINLSGKDSLTGSSLDFNVKIKSSFPSLISLGVAKVFSGKFSLAPSDFFLTYDFGVSCSTDILHASGYVEAYLVNPFIIPLSFANPSNVSYGDQIEIYSKKGVIIELPFEATATLVAVQTFCNPSGASAFAKANLSVALGGQKATAYGEVILEDGEFLAMEDANDRKVLKIYVPEGKSVFALNVEGTLYAKSVAMGVDPKARIVCGSNAGAISRNSLVVKNFTGENGTPLPEGLTIKGLISGIDYTGSSTSNNCPDLSKAKVDTVNARCGLANGRASISIPTIPNATFEWSNGRTGSSVLGLAKGSHYVIVRDPSGCAQAISFVIDDKSPVPTINLPPYVAIRKGETATLNAADTTLTGLTYSWSNGATTPSIEVTTPGTYKLTVTNAAKCSSSYSVDVFEKTGYWISDGNVKADVGNFYDDGGPTKDYTGDQNRLVTICPESPNKFIVLNFTEVDVINYNNQDVLRVFDGFSFDCPLDINVNRPASFTASATSKGCLTVFFRANSYDISGRGWKATITTTDNPPPGCLHEIRAGSGTFTDSGGENGSYANNEYKVYTICPPEQAGAPKYITLDFTTVDIVSTSVSLDHLAVYDGVGTSCILENNLRKPQTFTASSNSGGCLTVVFDSDNSSVREGWIARISTTETAVKPPEYCNCGTNPTPSNTCDEAPLINNLQTFCGVSSIDYSASIIGNMAQGFCGIIHNNSFFKFLAQDTTITFGYQSRGGTHKLCEGVQLAILQPDGACDLPKTNWKYLKCQNFNGLFTAGKLDVSGLVKGQEYYLMIDGSYGSECLYSLTAEKGFAACPLKMEKEEIICHPDGGYSVRIPIRGLASNQVYRVYEKNNLYKELKETTFIDDGKTTSILFGPYKPGRAYHIIISGGNDLDKCSLSVSGKAVCPLPPCGLSSTITAACWGDSDNITITGQISNATLPISIVSDVYQTILFPDSLKKENIVNAVIKRSALNRETAFYITDINMCQTEQIVKIPVCDDCPDDILLKPNPTDRQISFWYPCGSFEISIYDMTGRFFGNRSAEPSNETNSYSVNIGDLSSGNYLLRLQSEKAVITKKFTKY